MSKPVIETNSMVTLHFKLQLETGDIVDATENDQPMTIHIGDGTLKSCFEDAIMGLSSGDKQQVAIDPRESFGFRNETLIQAMEASVFDTPPAVGEILPFNQHGEEILGTIIEVKSKHVIVDFNHPLSGHTITFSADILDVQPPSIH